MPEVTRKLLVVEVPEDQWIWIVAHFHESCRIHELPTAEELGRVALAAHPVRETWQRREDCIPVGEAILKALKGET